MDPWCPLFLINNKQHMSVCTKTISSWVRRVLSIAKSHLSLNTVWDASVSVALMAGIYLILILQKGDLARDFTSARYSFSKCITNWHQDFV